MSIKDPIRKNILDLKFQKYNSLFNTILMVYVTLIGLLIAVYISIFISEKFDLIKLTQMFSLIAILISFIAALILKQLSSHLSNILNQLRKLRKEN